MYLLLIMIFKISRPHVTVSVMTVMNLVIEDFLQILEVYDGDYQHSKDVIKAKAMVSLIKSVPCESLPFAKGIFNCSFLLKGEEDMVVP